MNRTDSEKLPSSGIIVVQSQRAAELVASSSRANDVEGMSGVLDHFMSHYAKHKRLGSRAREVTHRFGVNGAMEMWDEALGTVPLDPKRALAMTKVNGSFS
jgi:hypothetical protein